MSRATSPPTGRTLGAVPDTPTQPVNGLADGSHPVAELRGICKTYFKPDGSVMVEALAGVDLTISRGEYVAIMGASGSGKSTLMNILGCLDQPTAGQYLLDGQDVSGMTDEALSAFRGTRVGFVFQAFNLIAQLKVEENIAVPLFYQHMSKHDRHQRALELLDRWPGPVPPPKWIQTMTAIAKDEVEHLALVTRLIRERGGKMTKHHRNDYAAALRKLVRLGQGNCDLLDRLMVSALIEARSCERFAVLAENCADAELAKLYRGLWASEAGHYRAFLEHADELLPAAEVEERWDEMLDAEARIIVAQPPSPTMHSGVA